MLPGPCSGLTRYEPTARSPTPSSAPLRYCWPSSRRCGKWHVASTVTVTACNPFNKPCHACLCYPLMQATLQTRQCFVLLTSSVCRLASSAEGCFHDSMNVEFAQSVHCITRRHPRAGVHTVSCTQGLRACPSCCKRVCIEGVLMLLNMCIGSVLLFNR